MKRTLLLAALCAATLPAHAVDGEILITQAKALAGNVTPGDAPGFPVTLSLPGKYKLAGNLTISDPSSHGIHVTAPNVTLDLNGFTMQGPVTCTLDPSSLVNCLPAVGESAGVLGEGTGRLVVRNGVLRGWHFGVRAPDVDIYARIEDLHISDIGVMGIQLSLISSGQVIGNTIVRSAAYAIQAAGIVRDNLVEKNRNTAINLGYHTLATGNHVVQSGSGFYGYSDWSAAFNVSPDSLDGATSLGGGNTNTCNGQPC